MKCKNCGATFRGNICACGYNPSHTSKRDEIDKCPLCNVLTRSKYLKAYAGQDICSNCLTIAQMEPAEREYLRTLADKYSFRLFDMPAHMDAANAVGQQIEQYLESLPRTPEQFREYFRGTENEAIAIQASRGME